MFVVLLGLAVQVAYDLYATSAVTGVAYDAARVVAGSDSTAAVDAEATAVRVLGRYGTRARFEWQIGADVVALRVVVPNPSFLPAALRRPLRVDSADRTVRVRVERLR